MKLGIIGGSGLNELMGMTDCREEVLQTPYGMPSAPLQSGKYCGSDLVFLSRHGKGHTIQPHEINYKANIAAMKMLGVTHILSISAVGSLRQRIRPRDVVVVDQYFDRSKQPPQDQTFFGDGIVGHISFADPVCPELSKLTADILEEAIRTSDDPGRRVFREGTYVNMAGPAFSTRAESRFYREMGFSVIGMTNLTEAKLAREAEICYTTAAFVTDFDCWHEAKEPVTLEMILGHMAANRDLSCKLIQEAAKAFSGLPRACACGSAMANAIVTRQDTIPQESKEKHALIFGKYLQ